MSLFNRYQGKHYSENNHKMSPKTKAIILSVIAMIELLLILVTTTFSWFDGLTALEISGEEFQTAAALNSHIEIGENKSASDNTYSEVINLSSFFDNQDRVRLAPVSSADAENFYVAYSGEAGKEGAKYRKLSTEDINSNVITFQFDITSPDGPTDIFIAGFDPCVIINTQTYYGTNAKVFPYRFAFSDGSTTRILTTRGNLDQNDTAVAAEKAVASLNADDTANMVTGTVERSRIYGYYPSPDEQGNTNHPLFTLNKGETKKITVSVWIEACDSNFYTTDGPQPGSNISVVLKLATSWSVTRNLTVYDYTAGQWVDNAGDSGEATKMFVRNADGNADARMYELTYDSSAHTWSGQIPHALENLTITWGKADKSAVYATWNAAGRGYNEYLSLLGNTAYVWGKEVTQISFRDYTSAEWVNNNGDDNVSPKMKVSINYEGRNLNYDMTDAPVRDEHNKNTWYCYIPSPVQTVRFDRCERTKDTVIYNSWLGTDRGLETIYRATDGDATAVEGEYTLYVTIADSIADSGNFYYGSQAPAISFTAASNQSAVTAVGTNYQNLSRHSYKPTEDTWPAGDSTMTRVEGTANSWYIVLDSKPAAGTKITFWNRTHRTYNDVDVSTSFGVFTFDGTNNTINVTGATKLTSSDANNNYYLTGSLSTSNLKPGTDVSKTESGEWGKFDVPEGTYTTYLVSTATATAVKVTFTYNNASYTFNMGAESVNKYTWSTTSIPDDATDIIFSDGTRTWSAANTTGRTSSKNYYYATSNTKGNWGAAPKQLNFFHLFTSGTGTDYCSSVTVTFKYNGETVTRTTTKNSSNARHWYTDLVVPPDAQTPITFEDNSGRKWDVSTRYNDHETPEALKYCYAVDFPATNGTDDNTSYRWYKTDDHMRVYITNSRGWSDNRIYYWGGSADSDAWPGATMININDNSDGQRVRCKVVPKNSSVIFNGTKSSNREQTVDITGVTDMKAYYVKDSKTGSNFQVGTWTPKSDFFKLE